MPGCIPLLKSSVFLFLDSTWVEAPDGKSTDWSPMGLITVLNDKFVIFENMFFEYFGLKIGNDVGY